MGLYSFVSTIIFFASFIISTISALLSLYLVTGLQNQKVGEVIVSFGQIIATIYTVLSLVLFVYGLYQSIKQKKYSQILLKVCTILIKDKIGLIFILVGTFSFMLVFFYGLIIHGVFHLMFDSYLYWTRVPENFIHIFSHIMLNLGFVILFFNKDYIFNNNEIEFVDDVFHESNDKVQEPKVENVEENNESTSYGTL
jgi:hypothetical protein